MATKIKKLDLKRSGAHKLVQVTLEKGGKEYVFTAKATDVLDESRFRSLLKMWDEQAIPEAEKEAGMTDEAIEERLKKIKNPEQG